MPITFVQLFWRRPCQRPPARLGFWTFLSQPLPRSTYRVISVGWCGVPLPDPQAASYPRDLAGSLGPQLWHRTSSGSYPGHSVAGDADHIRLGRRFRLHGAWRSWRMNCKLLLLRWWRMSGRWGRAGVFFFFHATRHPMMEVTSQPPLKNKQCRGNRRMAPL